MTEHGVRAVRREQRREAPPRAPRGPRAREADGWQCIHLDAGVGHLPGEPAVETQGEPRLHARSGRSESGEREEHGLHAAVEIPAVDVKDSHYRRAVPY